MFQIIQNADNLVLSNGGQTQATIGLSQEGGRLQSLAFKGYKIIDDLEHKAYAQSYAGSILFPFANRIKDGKYKFQNKTYRLDCNENDRDNAIHGLIYNKIFELKSVEEFEDHAEAILVYEETNPPKGFPFPYQIELTYKLSDKKLSLKVDIKNTGNQVFPFTLGWHPYFCCDDFDTSFLSFNSHKVVIMSRDMIALGVNERPVENPFSMKNKKLDDCFVLNGREIEFYTKDYKITLEGTPKSNFFQIYTPPNENRIALEPMTGISDSFNHKKGLQILKPGDTKTETWTIALIDKSL